MIHFALLPPLFRTICATTISVRKQWKKKTFQVLHRSTIVSGSQVKAEEEYNKSTIIAWKDVGVAIQVERPGVA